MNHNINTTNNTVYKKRNSSRQQTKHDVTPYSQQRLILHLKSEFRHFEYNNTISYTQSTTASHIRDP